MTFPTVSRRQNQGLARVRTEHFTVFVFSQSVTSAYFVPLSSPFLHIVESCFDLLSSWLSWQSISELKQHEIESYITDPHQKREDLLQAYKIALDPQKWEEDMKKNMDMEDDAPEEPEEEVDELEGEDEANGEKKGKKRKRASVPSAKTKAPKAKKEKSPSESAPKKKKASVEKADKPAKAKKNGVKSKAMVESEDEGERAEAAGPSKKASPPPNKKQKREKEELDRMFLHQPSDGGFG